MVVKRRRFCRLGFAASREKSKTKTQTHVVKPATQMLEN